MLTVGFFKTKMKNNMSTTKEMFENECYELYKIDWMLRHRYTLTDLVDQLKDIAEMTVDEDRFRACEDPPEGSGWIPVKVSYHLSGSD